MRIEGVFVASITPFKSGGDVDYEELSRHLEFLASQGVHGFVPCGTTGEGCSLNEEEWREIVRLTQAVAKRHGLSVIAGCGGNSPEKVLGLLRVARETGCDAGLVVTPYYNKPTQEGLKAYYQTLVAEIDFPIVLYNVPSRTGVNLLPETAAQLFRSSSRMIGIKEASGQYAQWMSIASKVDLSSCSLLAGDDDAFAIVLGLGGSGIISAAANVIPKHFVTLFDFAVKGKWKEAFELQLKIYPLIRTLFLETNPSPLKFALQITRQSEGRLRLPLVPVTIETEAAIRLALESLL